LTCSALTYPPAHGDILIQATSLAQMVVDYVNTAKTAVYGYVTTGTFNTANSVSILSSSQNTVMTPSSFIPSDAAAAPHWYAWTAYPDTKDDEDVVRTYGSLPTSAYLGCLYRGRCVLSGDPHYPHQWYMSRVANPWDWKYVVNDSLAPVAGNNTDAGEIGDIVRALIPYKDDYLVFGCSDSIWFLNGDPAAGGSLNELSLVTGIYGAFSHCWDDIGNLYFWGIDGLYRSNIPGFPTNISKMRLPNIIVDEAADPNTHRVVLGYDRKRHAVLISIVTIATGANSNYFFDISEEAFYPESYPTAGGPYSLFYYAANDPAYSDLLVGCKDGYIRKFNNSLKSDNLAADAVGVGTSIISSYVVLGPMPLNKDPDNFGKISMINVTTAGGGSGGTQADSNDIQCRIFTGYTPEEIIENVVANSGFDFTVTILGPAKRFGKGQTLRQRARGMYAAIRLANSTVDQSWAFEQVTGIVQPSGKMR